MRYLLLFCLLFQSVSYAADDELFVELSSEVQLMPVALSAVNAQESTLASGYGESLRQVLLFDIDHNGMTKVEKQNASLDFAKLKDEGILYFIQLTLKGKELITKVVSINTQTANTIDRVFLTGDLSVDRVIIHHLADSIHKVLFGKAGVASCRILFTIKKQINEVWRSEVFISDYDGHNVRQVTNDGSFAANPIFMPNSEFLYVSYKIGQPKVYKSNVNKHNPVRMSTLRGNQVTPGINHDYSLLGFASDVTGTPDIFLQPLDDSKPIHAFAAKGATNASPAFSPDGKKMVFVSNKDGVPKVYMMNIPRPGTSIKNLRPELISKRCRENTAPSWSPDGKKIAYCSRNYDERQIWVYDLETKTERQLTQGRQNKENPVWAPNSLHLLFNANDDKGTDLYLINLNQKEAVKITSGPFAKLFPTWEPKTL